MTGNHGASDSPALSFVICAYNSAAVIEETIEILAKRLADTPSEIIVVENGSTDGTREILDRLAKIWVATSPTLRVMSVPKGFGNALRLGLLSSTGKVIVATADDLPFGFDDLDAAERIGYAPNRVVIGSKGHPESDIGGRPLVRTVLTAGFRVLRRVLLGMRTADPQGSYIMDGAWARSVAPALHENGFLIATEIAYAADLSGNCPIEVPIRLRESHHATRVRLSDIGQMGFGLIRLRRRRSLLQASAQSPAGPGPQLPRQASAPAGEVETQARLSS